MNAGQQIATLGGGCFWCLEAAFNELAGIEQVVSGYSGGDIANPSYEQVCRGDTGHAEVVRVLYDPAVIAYGDILAAFFAVHDPTTLNRQGNDVGTQYRSVIFYHTPEQKEVAETTIATLGREKAWPHPIVTQVLPAPAFYPAEEYHQDYYRQHSGQPYCAVVVAPKVAKLRASFGARLKSR